MKWVRNPKLILNGKKEMKITNQDRYTNYIANFKKRLARIPESERPDSKSISRILLSAVKPIAIRQLVKKSMDTGKDPRDASFSQWRQESRKDSNKMKRLIKDICLYVDREILFGRFTEKWPSANNDNSSSKSNGKSSGDGNKSNGQKSICRSFANKGTCGYGDNCKYSHAVPNDVKSKSNSSSSNQKSNGDSKKSDSAESSDSPISKYPYKDFKYKTDGSARICLCCGSSKHMLRDCDKLSKYESQLKSEIGYDGNPKWFMMNGWRNAEKSIDLFRAKNWYQKSNQPEFLSLFPNLIDGGMCKIGYGKNAIECQLLIDLGGSVNIGSRHLYMTIAKLIKAGSLGAARLAPEVNITANAFDGKNSILKSFIQLSVTAKSVSSIGVCCMHQYISFSRECSDDVIIAGQSLCKLLGYRSPKDQQRDAAVSGIPVENVVQVPIKNENIYNTKDANFTSSNMNQVPIIPSAREYFGTNAFNYMRSSTVAFAPELQYSYVTTSVLGRSNGSFEYTSESYGSGDVELKANYQYIKWLNEGKSFVSSECEFDCIRILRNHYPLFRRSKSANSAKNDPVVFRVVEGSQPRVVLGRCILNMIEEEDGDRNDPIQSEVENYDEQYCISNALDAVIDQAVLNGLPREYVGKYTNLIKSEYFGLFRMRLSKSRPALFPSLKISLKPGAKFNPGKPFGLKLSPDKLEDLISSLNEMQSCGIIADAPIDCKPNSMLQIQESGKDRYVIAPMAANEVSEDAPLPSMENLELLQSRLRMTKFFAKIDLMKAYWQIPLHQSSQFLFCFFTPIGNKMYLRSPMGAKTAGVHFDICFMKMLEDAGLLRKGVEMVHDDVAIGSTSICDDSLNSHYNLLRRVFQAMDKHQLNLNPKKLVLFCTSMKFAGYYFDKDGIRTCPTRFQAILDEPEPKNLAEVYKGLCVSGWSRPFIPNYAVLEKPIRDFVNLELKKKGSRKMRVAAKVDLKDTIWDAELLCQYKQLRKSEIDGIIRAYRDYSKVSVLLKDASYWAWAYSITQVDAEELSKPWCDQHHELLVCRSGLFNHTQRNWHISCKEFFPTSQAIRNDSFYLKGNGPFVIGDDHENIVHIVMKKNRPASIGKASQDRLNRECVMLMMENFMIYRVPGVDNLYNDYHTRTGAPNHGTSFITLSDHANALEKKLSNFKIAANGKAVAKQFLLLAPVDPVVPHKFHHLDCDVDINKLMPNVGEFVWPSLKIISKAQGKMSWDEGMNFKLIDGVKIAVDDDDKIILPDGNQDLLNQVIAVAHRGQLQHLPMDQTVKVIQDHFYFDHMDEYIRDVCRTCIGCMKVRGGRYVPRPMGHQITATRPFEVISLDWLSLPMAPDGTNKLLVITDHLYGLKAGGAAKSASGEMTAKILNEKWLMYFPDPLILLSDGAPHFNNELLLNIAGLRGYDHRILTAYTPWSNLAERAIASFLNVARKVLNQLSRPITDWPILVPAVFGILNKYCKYGNTGCAPIEGITAICCKNAVSQLANDFALDVDVINPDDVIEDLDGLHKAIQANWDKAVQYKKHRQYLRDLKQKLPMPPFAIGNLILVACCKNDSIQSTKDKLLPFWRGPYIITGIISPYVVSYRPFVRDESLHVVSQAHISRVKLFCTEYLGKEAVFHAEAEKMIDYHGVEKIVGHIMSESGQMYLEIKWCGCDSDANLRILVDNLYNDIPDMVVEYLVQNSVDFKECAQNLVRLSE